MPAEPTSSETAEETKVDDSSSSTDELEKREAAADEETKPQQKDEPPVEPDAAEPAVEKVEDKEVVDDAAAADDDDDDTKDNDIDDDDDKQDAASARSKPEDDMQAEEPSKEDSEQDNNIPINMTDDAPDKPQDKGETQQQGAIASGPAKEQHGEPEPASIGTLPQQESALTLQEPALMKPTKLADPARELQVKQDTGPPATAAETTTMTMTHNVSQQAKTEPTIAPMVHTGDMLMASEVAPPAPAPATVTTQGNTASTNGDGEEDISMTFPQRLMEILDKDEEHGSIISWLPHGRGFMIYKKKQFESDVMPLYFHKHSKYTSFTRKLNRWGFVRVTRGPEMGAYYHKFFQRGEGRMCMQMSCQRPNSGNDGMQTELPPTMFSNFPGAAPGGYNSPHPGYMQQQQMQMQMLMRQREEIFQREMMHQQRQHHPQQQGSPPSMAPPHGVPMPGMHHPGQAQPPDQAHQYPHPSQAQHMQMAGGPMPHHPGMMMMNSQAMPPYTMPGVPQYQMPPHQQHPPPPQQQQPVHEQPPPQPPHQAPEPQAQNTNT